MSEPFLGEIKIVAFNFPPKGWSLCNGQLLPINQNQALFSILALSKAGKTRLDWDRIILIFSTSVTIGLIALYVYGKATSRW